MNIRPATEQDEAALRALWEEFEAETPEPPGFEPDTWVEAWAAFRGHLEAGAVYLAEDGADAVGMADVSSAGAARWHIETVYVRPGARRQRIATAMLRQCVREAREHGAQYVSLEVLAANEVAQRVWRELGFEPVGLLLGQTLDSLERRLADVPIGASRATTHVQSDDRRSVERAVAQFVPRLESPDVGAEGSGWIRISDPVTDNDRQAQGRLAGELSDRLGAVVVALAVEAGSVVRFRLYERGLMVDEYLSVPTFYGELSQADAFALAANPTLVARLTGADRDEVRRVARTAASPADLPPAEDLYRQIAATMGLEL